jgi:hypothetical protein
VHSKLLLLLVEQARAQLCAANAVLADLLAQNTRVPGSVPQAVLYQALAVKTRATNAYIAALQQYTGCRSVERRPEAQVR